MKNILMIAVSVLIFACSASQETSETEQGKEPDIYVFDDVDKVDSTIINNVSPVPPEEKIQPAVADNENKNTIEEYIVQLGAFSTKSRAERFITENQNKVNLAMNVSFNSETNLFVVQLPPLDNREDAEKLRNSIWDIPVFNDAFIITKEK